MAETNLLLDCNPPAMRGTGIVATENPHPVDHAASL
jgi:hypothetical protein